MKKAQTNPHSPDGFSAVELMAVMVIMALLAALAVPALFHGSGALHLAAAAQTITHCDSLARSHAIARRTSVTMTLFPGENRIVLSSPTDTWSKTLTLPASIQLAGVTIKPNAKTTSSVSVLFSSPGWSVPYAVDLAARVNGGQTLSKTLEFNPFTGPTDPTQ